MAAQHLHSLVVMEEVLDSEIERLENEFVWESKKLVYLQALDCDERHMSELVVKLQKSQGLIGVYKLLLERTFQEKVMYMEKHRDQQHTRNSERRLQQQQPQVQQQYDECSCHLQTTERSPHVNPHQHSKYASSVNKLKTLKTVPRSTALLRKYRFRALCRSKRHCLKGTLQHSNVIQRRKQHMFFSAIKTRARQDRNHKKNNSMLQPRFACSSAKQKLWQYNLTTVLNGEGHNIDGLSQARMQFHERHCQMGSEMIVMEDYGSWRQGEMNLLPLSNSETMCLSTELHFDLLQNDTRL